MEVPKKTKVHTVYKLQSGERVPSVTTILGILGKPALIHWAWTMGCEGKDYRAVRDDAATVGTLAHYLILCYLKREAPDTSEYSAEDIDRAENALLKFWDWEKSHTIEPILVEASLISECYGFGGTIDFYGVVDGEETLVDFKTGKALYDEHFLQLAAYEQLLAENDYLVSAVKILRIGRDSDEGFEERSMGIMANQLEVFEHCRGIYNLQKAIKKGA